MGVFDYESGNGQGILIHALGITLIHSILVVEIHKSKSSPVYFCT